MSEMHTCSSAQHNRVFSLLPSLLVFLHYITPQKSSFCVHSTSELGSITFHSVSGFSEPCLAGVYYPHLAKREVSGPESHSSRMAEDSFECRFIFNETKLRPDSNFRRKCQ
jgi:hypothetical protein